MANDVHGLFRKINQVDLPYRVFESDDRLAQEEEARLEAPRPKAVTSPLAPAAAAPVTIPAPANAPVVQPRAAGGLMRKYAAPPPVALTAEGSTNLRQLFEGFARRL